MQRERTQYPYEQADLAEERERTRRVVYIYISSERNKPREQKVIERVAVTQSSLHQKKCPPECRESSERGSERQKISQRQRPERLSSAGSSEAPHPESRVDPGDLGSPGRKFLPEQAADVRPSTQSGSSGSSHPGWQVHSR